VKVELSRDWSEFLSVLISHRVKFVLVGGHAVAAHGEPRLTEDLDVFVEPVESNGERVRAALIDFGFGEGVPTGLELSAPGKVWMLGRKPQRIDILTGISGLTFAEAWRSRVELEFVRKPLFVIGRAALIRNKLASAREKDLRDVAVLKELAPRRSKRRPRARKQ
jgi:hypothetical protein